MILRMGQHWDRLGEAAVQAEESYKGPKCSTCQCVQSAEAGEVVSDRGQIAEVGVVEAAWSFVRGRSSSAEAHRGQRIAAADEGFAEKLSLAGPEENRLRAIP